MKDTLTSAKEGIDAPRVEGCIDVIREDLVYGWVTAFDCPMTPMLFIDGKPASLLESHSKRPDVALALGVDPDVGFTFRVSNLKETSRLTLCAALPNAFTPVVSKEAGTKVFENRFFAQLERAQAVAREEGAVAITCWDGAHNPIGRAKVLYDVVHLKRPCVLFTFVEQGYGDVLWRPLQASDLCIVTVPWGLRSHFVSIAAAYELRFQTVWICKPRLPSFLLARAVSEAGTRFICDMDDDEEAFVRMQADSNALNNLAGLGLANDLRDRIVSKTVVSRPLQKRFGGVLVRHVRKVRAKDEGKRSASSFRSKRIAFIGTVRPHKNLLAIAHALRELNVKQSIEFDVFGDVAPQSFVADLEAGGASVQPGFLSAGELQKKLSQVDVLITGFPATEMNDACEKAVVAAQVPAKISDALAAGIPVLTPETPSVGDLRKVNGLYLFTQKNFSKQVENALNHTEPITLPFEFTLEGGNAAFLEAEQKAEPCPALSRLLPEEGALDGEVAATKSSPALVLLWKQQDAGLYGRRIDQIARSYGRRFSGHRVVVLELEQATEETDDKESNAFDEAEIKEALLLKKRRGVRQGNVFYKTLQFASKENLRKKLVSFLIEEKLFPVNTLLVLFPILDQWETVSDILTPFSFLVDVVDNQFAWATSDARRSSLFAQYKAVLSQARHVFFNSETNHQFFLERKLVDPQTAVSIIPNWYSLPDSFSFTHKPMNDGLLHLFYSGNMNDRIDWQLLTTISKQKYVRLHLVGTVARRVSEIRELFFRPHVIYHGVKSEVETLALLEGMDVAIIPHVLDRVSRFMNPLKRFMYEAVGLPLLLPENLSYLACKEGRTFVYHSPKECLEILNTMLIQKNSGTLSLDSCKGKDLEASQDTGAQTSEALYLNALTDLRKAS